MPDNETHCSEVSSVSLEACATTVQRTNKSVRFELHPDSAGFSSESSAQRIKLSESGSSSASMPSPYPTPLHLTDEMQTPGTVFPAYVNNIAGVTTKIRSQYVYSVLNPIQYHSQWKELDEEHSDSNQQRESPNPNDEATMMSTPMSDTVMDNLSVKNDKKDELSLSQWLKPQTANENVGENVHFGRTPGDRPILGMVAAHWNEASHISPKWCGGNGIPNSTTKYKEASFAEFSHLSSLVFVLVLFDYPLVNATVCRIRKLVGTRLHLRRDSRRRCLKITSYLRGMIC